MPETFARDPFAGLTLAAARRAIAQRLRAADIDSPDRDARLLIELATGLSATGVMAHDHRELDAMEANTLHSLAGRRLNHEPIARLRGAREFYGRTFDISPAVLDPRPETETIVETGLEIVKARDPLTAPLRILDVGTGSGCLIVTFLAELPSATGLATDVSQAALDVARRNAGALGTGGRVRFETRRSLAGLGETFDLLVSNPPYIPSGELAGLEPGVAHYDPALALDGGPDGLDIYRELAREVERVVPRGWIALEVGAGQANAVVDIFRGCLDTGLKDVRLVKDLAGHVRCVAMQTQF